MKKKTWQQIDAQFMRLQKALDDAIIKGNITLVTSKRWDTAFNAWSKAHKAQFNL